MLDLTGQFGGLMLAVTEHAAPVTSVTSAVPGAKWLGWILWLPAISTVLCGLCAALRVKGKAPAWITVGLLGASFLVTLAAFAGYEGPTTTHLFDWFNIQWSHGGKAGAFVANFALYVDGLTLLWMLFVTGLGTLIALYASEYMEGDVGPGKGYARFFAGVSVFLFAMGSLVMGDNLLMLYLGWEGVGFASYWLIGYFYQKPSAVEAAKKAFIVNRIGDLGLALAIYFLYDAFGTLEYARLFPMIAHASGETAVAGWHLKVIPFLVMLGAFGKSAQIPLYVWLPDAMEGPTPVSALIHAATMVTAGVYLLCRMFPVMGLHPDALATVAWIGGLTALLAATIGMAQYDIKRIMAYSTVSQLGYMFLGIGVMTTFGAAYHVFTHAFFKAVLFLTCGAIMHGFAGQLDLRKVSGLASMPGWRVVALTMGYACLCLTGFPILGSGFYSKDLIMAQAFITPGFAALGVIAALTALLTAYYTFRVFFRVCMGPVNYEMGQDHHGPDDHAHATGAAVDHHAADKPHAPRLAINAVLLIISAGAVASIFLGGWAEKMVEGSSALAHAPHAAPESAHEAGIWADPHQWMPWLAGAITLLGIGIAWFFHLANRKAADAMKASLLGNPATRWLPRAMENKWYVDEIYHAMVQLPLWVIAHALYMFDRYIIDLLMVRGIASLPRRLGRSFQPLANGVLQSYAVSMAGGAALVVILVLVMPQIIEWLRHGGTGTALVQSLGGGP